MSRMNPKVTKFLLVTGAALLVFGSLQIGAALTGASRSSTPMILGAISIVAGVVDIAYALLKRG